MACFYFLFSLSFTLLCYVLSLLCSLLLDTAHFWRFACLCLTYTTKWYKNSIFWTDNYFNHQVSCFQLLSPYSHPHKFLTIHLSHFLTFSHSFLITSTLTSLTHSLFFYSHFYLLCFYFKTFIFSPRLYFIIIVLSLWKMPLNNNKA